MRLQSYSMALFAAKDKRDTSSLQYGHYMLVIGLLSSWKVIGCPDKLPRVLRIERED